MTLEELRIRKGATEIQISTLLERFERETGTRVWKIGTVPDRSKSVDGEITVKHHTRIEIGF